MNKAELIKKIADRCDYTQKDVRCVIDAFEEEVVTSMRQGEDVKTGIVTFTVKDTKARVARNLHTGEQINVPAGKKVAIKISKTLKDSVK